MKAALLVLAALAGCTAEAPPAPPPGPCKAEVFEASRFTHCIVDPRRARIELRLDGKDGLPLRSLSALADSMDERGDVLLAANAGMFGDDGMPIGLYVEAGAERVALNRKEGGGNFHLMPNGVFWGDGGTWNVDTSDHYATLEMATPPPYATQSGPMLVIDGKLHPEFDEDGSSRHFRNGVGVDAKGRVHFAISDDLVSFGKFARFFRDVAKTPDALYLDGAVSALWDPANDRIDVGPPLGPLIVVLKPAKAKR